MSRAKEYKCGFHCVAHLYALFIAQQNSEHWSPAWLRHADWEWHNGRRKRTKAKSI